MDDVSVLPARHKLDVDDYHRMAEAGILDENDRVELIDGALIDMAPIGQGHAAIVTRLNRMLVLAGDKQAIVSPQNPVRLDRYNEPQPDLAMLRYRADFYETGEPPGPADVLLLIEVADSSLAFDRRVKLPLYARWHCRVLDRRRATTHSRRSQKAGRRWLRRDDHPPFGRPARSRLGA